jgi:nucleoside 2-deoxyribosyltransferase
MPFAREFDPVFLASKVAVSNALPGEEIECSWLKDTLAAGRITDDILHGIQHSAFCIADISGNNPNVMWETGYAMALGKPTILIGQSVDTLPFDLKIHRVLLYKIEHLDQFTDNLANAVRQTLARYELHTKMDEAVRTLSLSTSRTIAVTGTMTADEARARQRIWTVLQPYMDADVTWYCGGRGKTDELVLAYLVAQGKRPTVVGYNRYELSPTVRKMITDRTIGLVDASVENLPKGLKGPSERDVFFASKTDLVILFWDGESSGTQRLVDHFKFHKINALIGFV